MAMITCTECGKKISSKATACPNCGCPLSDMDRNKITDELFLQEQKDSLNQFLSSIEEVLHQYATFENEYYKFYFGCVSVGAPEKDEQECLKDRKTYTVPIFADSVLIDKFKEEIKTQTLYIMEVVKFTADDKILVNGEYYKNGKKSDSHCTIGKAFHDEFISSVIESQRAEKERLEYIDNKYGLKNYDLAPQALFVRQPFKRRIDDPIEVLARSNAFVNETLSVGSRIVYSNGNVYIGQMTDGLRNGDGVLWFDGGSIEGNFDHGELCGYYKYMTDRGGITWGESRDGKFHGPAKFKNVFGTIYNRVYDNGSLIFNEIDSSCVDYLKKLNYGALIATKEDILSINIGLASSDNIVKWSTGEVCLDDSLLASAEQDQVLGLALNDLHDEEIFGGIEKGKSTNQYGYICLGCPVVNAFYYEKESSCLELLLDMTFEDLRNVIHRYSYIVLNPGYGYQYEFKQILTDEESKQIMAAQTDSEDNFEIGTGTEAIKKLLSFIDLDSMLIECEDTIRTTNSEKEKALTLQKQQLVKNLIRYKASPEWFVQTVIPVLPEYMRPTIKRITGTIRYSSIDYTYANLLVCSHRLCRLIKLNAPNCVIDAEKRMVQAHVENLFNYGSIPNMFNRKNKNEDSLFDYIMGLN